MPLHVILVFTKFALQIGSSEHSVATGCFRMDNLQDRNAPRKPPSRTVLQQLPCDHQSLDLSRSFANRAEFDIAAKLFGEVVLDIAISFVNLYALFGDAHRDLFWESPRNLRGWAGVSFPNRLHVWVIPDLAIIRSAESL